MISPEKTTASLPSSPFVFEEKKNRMFFRDFKLPEKVGWIHMIKFANYDHTERLQSLITIPDYNHTHRAQRKKNSYKMLKDGHLI